MTLSEPKHMIYPRSLGKSVTITGQLALAQLMMGMELTEQDVIRRLDRVIERYDHSYLDTDNLTMDECCTRGPSGAEKKKMQAEQRRITIHGPKRGRY